MNAGGWRAGQRCAGARVRRRAEPRNSHGGRLRGALAARWPDRNPLRRPIDRIEVVAMIMLVVAFLAGAPFTAAATSTWARHGAEAAARLERATWHPVAAVVLRGAPGAVQSLRAGLPRPGPGALDPERNGARRPDPGRPRDADRRHRQGLDRTVRRSDRASAVAVADHVPRRARRRDVGRGPGVPGDCFRCGHPAESSIVGGWPRGTPNGVRPGPSGVNTADYSRAGEPDFRPSDSERRRNP